MAHTRKNLRIIGVGNPFRGDDAAGVLAARQLKDMETDSLAIMEHSGEGTSLLEIWKGVGAVILIDAVSSGQPAGTIHRLNPIQHPLPTQMFQGSTHAFSLPQAIEMARALGQLPPRLLVFGIEGHNFQAGADLSPGVSAALPRVVRQVRDQVKIELAKIEDGE